MSTTTTTQTPTSRPTSFEAYLRVKQLMFTPEGIGAGLSFRPRSTDVFISPFAKCGTTWLQQMVHSLRTGGDLDFDDISRVVPWIETAHDLGLDLNAPQRAEPRAFKSHLSWHAIPKGGRYIVAFRDPRDALVSMFRFKEGWVFERDSIEITELARREFMDCDEGLDYWTHLLSWWQQRDNPDVLLLVYEQMKQDLRGTIEKVADFLGITLTGELLATVLEESSFESMMAHKDRYGDLLMRRRSEAVADIPPGGDSSKVRKGQVGTYRHELPPDVVAELDAIWAEKVTPVTGAGDYASFISSW